MARITVEDCLEHVNNRFTLVLVASERAKQLLKGSDTLLDSPVDNKEVVTALREVAAAKIDVDESDVRPDPKWLPLHHAMDLAPLDDDELPPEI